MIFWVPLFPFALIFCSYCEMIPVRAFLILIVILHFLDDPTVLLGRRNCIGWRRKKFLIAISPFQSLSAAGFFFVLSGLASDF
jgi:hypothetical protein